MALSFSPFFLYLQAPDFLEGVFPVCSFCLARHVLSLPIHVPSHAGRYFRTPESLGLAEQIDMWEWKRQSFREEEEVKKWQAEKAERGERETTTKRGQGREGRGRKKNQQQNQP